MGEGCEKDQENVLVRTRKGILPRPGSDNSLLREKHFGDEEGFLSPVETLYLLERRKFRLLDGEREIPMGEFLLQQGKNDPKILPRYIVYRDWRDRGLFPVEMERAAGELPAKGSRSILYPAEEPSIPDLGKVTSYFFKEAEMAVLFDRDVAERLYYDAWIGQLGKYKQEEAGSYLSLDLIETLFLLRQRTGFMAIDVETGLNLSFEKLMRFATARHPGMEDLLSVYEDWRRSGYIVKTGFKFGAHFRIYLPGAGTGKDKWVHSKHVLHVFPKSYSMLMSEWGRIIRLSQSVKKTFILGVPSLSESDYDQVERGDLVLYHRTKDGVEEPGRDKPTFLCIAIPETLRMSGLEFARALREAENKGLQLLMAVVDRETDINYYVARKIELPGSRNDYYEICWYRP